MLQNSLAKEDHTLGLLESCRRVHRVADGVVERGIGSKLSATEPARPFLDCCNQGAGYPTPAVLRGNPNALEERNGARVATIHVIGP